MNTANPEFQPRRSERRSVELRAFLVRGEKQLTDAFVTDISYDGCRIETEEKLKAGQRRELRVARRGISHVEVRWTDGDKAGAMFVG
ncbi:PilZ domain-containing protein [Sphingomonas rhizophila]|uniref:PilZ domain-containing protein n=1 Tax=Sphingomonas rhizophila TaxID=2071607 RepID=A0A7G9SCE3_9SPHN|nr:PilZ domain-containing protein [Sphingomonas rhizophila]QNN65518.1 PilZ domain-containing protein [Sphingomonas rhizophila]